MTPGRASTAYASAYSMDEVHQSRCYRAQRRTYRVIWKGALEAGQVVSSVTWWTDAPWILVMSDPLISDAADETTVNVLANNDGMAVLKCEVTLNNGDIRNQLFRVWVKPQYSGFGAGQGATGPYSVSTSTVGFIALEDDSAGDAPYVELEDA